jgi:hypothetical protein
VGSKSPLETGLFLNNFNVLKSLLEMTQRPKVKGAMMKACLTLRFAGSRYKFRLSLLVLVTTWALHGCQSLSKFYNPSGDLRSVRRDTGLYASGMIDARPGWSKLRFYHAGLFVIDDSAIERSRRVLRALDARSAELSDWALPLLAQYLPPGEGISARIVVDIGLPHPFSVDADRDLILVDAGAGLFQGDVKKILDDSRHEINRLTFDRILGRSLALSQSEGRELWLLARIARDGMVRYLSQQGDTLTLNGSADVPKNDVAYDLIEDPWAPLSDKFLLIERILERVPKGAPDKTWRAVLGELDRADQQQDLFDKVGVFMAKTIERQLGRQSLVDALANGPRAFYDAYQSTRPGALMMFRIPETRGSGVAH